MKHIITALLLFLTAHFACAQSITGLKATETLPGMFASGDGSHTNVRLIGSNSNNNTAYLADLNYRVLLGVFTHRIPIESDYWAAVRSDLAVTSTNNGFAYTVGFYKSYNEALAMCRSLMQKGYLQAAVATFQADKVVEVLRP